MTGSCGASVPSLKPILYTVPVRREGLFAVDGTEDGEPGIAVVVQEPSAGISFAKPMSTSSSQRSSSYRLEVLPEVPAFHRDALRKGRLERGHLVYYGPKPSYYGIGEVKRINGSDIAVDFRGTGHFDVHEEIIEQRYLIRIPNEKMAEL